MPSVCGEAARRLRGARGDEARVRLVDGGDPGRRGIRRLPVRHMPLEQPPPATPGIQLEVPGLVEQLGDALPEQQVVALDIDGPDAAPDGDRAGNRLLDR